MKINPSKVTAVTLLCCLLALFALAAGKLSQLTGTLTLADTNLFEIAVPGSANYSVSFGALATNLANRLGLPVAAAAGGDWIVNEQFMGDNVALTLGAVGSSPWRYSNAGSVPVQPNPILGDAAMTGYLSLCTTQAGSGQTLLLGASGVGQNMCMTNGSLFLSARIRIGQTNVIGDVSTLRLGIGRAEIASEPPTGAFFMVNTNVGTNTLVCVTARNNSRTFTYTGFTWLPRQWFNVAIFFDTTSTNAVFYAGTNTASMTAIATNTTNLPGALYTLVNPWINNWRVFSSGGLASQTNYVDYYKLWARSDSE